MCGAGAQGPDLQVLLVYYSQAARASLESVLFGLGIALYAVDGRAPDAVDAVKARSTQVVVLDTTSSDISVSQAVRRLGQILPNRVVLTLGPDQKTVNVHRGGRRIGTRASLESALLAYGAREVPACAEGVSPHVGGAVG